MSNYKIESPLSCSSQLRLFGTNSANYINLSSASTSSAVDFTLPATNGTADQYLQRSGATSTTWTTGKPATTGDTIPLTLRMISGNFPASPTTISSVAFTILSYFSYGGTTSSRTPQTLTAVFSITPANTNASIRLGDQTNSVPNIVTLTCTSTTTSITFASIAIPSGSIPASQAVMTLSAAITTATSISIYSINIS